LEWAVIPESIATPYSEEMPIVDLDSVRSCLTVAVIWGLSGGISAAASEADLQPESEGPPLQIVVETIAAVLESQLLADGTPVKKWVPATELLEGQVVYYTVRITNPGQQAAHNVVVTKPVPANTRYIADSAVAPGARVTFSIDGGLTFASARDLRIKAGQGAAKPAPPERYTHIRWQMRYPLAPGATALARFRAVFH
jgi:uncharacterized repeat protein (TIGR01451 family)